MTSPIVLAIICALMLTGGQIMWKFGLQRMGGFMVNGQGAMESLLAAATSPLIIAGGVAYALATLIWFNVLSRLPLSVAYPIMSLGYIAGVFAGWLIFREQVAAIRWAGVAFIMLGVGLVARS